MVSLPASAIGFTAMLWLMGQAVSGAQAAEITVPLPSRVVTRMPGPYQVQLGSRAMAVSGFVTDLSDQDLLTFYQERLPHAGWRLETLPWQAEHGAAMAQLQQAAAAQPEGADSQQLQRQLASMEQTARGMKRQLYASQGTERIIVNLLPVAGGTMVFLNRWTESEGEKPGSRAFTSANVCCSSEAVPGMSERLPFGVPTYPGARVLASGTPQTGGSSATVLVTPDEPQAVMAFYARAMSEQGWQPDDERSDEAGGTAELLVAVYRRQGTICRLSSQRPDSDTKTVITVSVTSTPSDTTARVDR